MSFVNLLIICLTISSVISTSLDVQKRQISQTKFKKSGKTWTGRPEEEPVLSDFTPDPDNAGINPRPYERPQEDEMHGQNVGNAWPKSVEFEEQDYTTLVVITLVISNIVLIALVVVVYYTPISQLSTK